MITKNKIPELLLSLGYSEIDSLFSKTFNQNTNRQFSISVDIENGKFIYPKEIIIHRETTTNFVDNENFVVFEIINRLFVLGYMPKNIELEMLVKVGRGRENVTAWADVLIKDNSGKYYAIIEAKTYGVEFSNSWKKTLNDGYQLFSYVEQLRSDQSIPYGVLYASDFRDGKVERKYHLLTFKDNDEFLKEQKKKKRKLYVNSSNGKELFDVWKATYDQDYSPIGMFEDDSKPFGVMEKQFTIKDIYNNPLETDGLIHQFRTILRQHNVSGRENAFDRLLNLLLAKVVDEKQSEQTGRPLDFYWRGVAFDDKKALVDRLQRLYRDGMRDYLKEDVTYIDKNDVDNAFILFKNDQDATKDLIHHYFEKLKFYTDNFFAFIDVYNEDLFEKNFEILSSIVRLFQDVSLTNSNQHQFLGDLFEKLLDQGIKQSEGQFFTPLPIVRFIVSSLPIKDMIENGKVPKVIDYASGSGHFLTEYASIITKLGIPAEILPIYYQNIHGIEKESRLAKVSKVSALMYGATETQIFFHDALSKFEEVEDGSYDFIIANPPYSVSGFLETLSEEDRNNYELSKYVSNLSNNKAIEAFFLERAKQLLKPGGIAAIILPSSILQKNEGVYFNVRKQLLESFDIIAIFEAGSGTFGKTGTTTDTLFLRKKHSKINLLKHYANRVEAWYKEDFDKDELFDDKEKLQSFSDLLGISNDDVLKDGTLMERLTYYLLSESQENVVQIIKTPTTSSEIQKFLGYEWSNRKGSEGIKYPSGDIQKIETPLYNPNNFNDESKVNVAIRENYLNNNIHNENINTSRLSDLISWNSTDFDLAINVNLSKQKIVTLKKEEKLVSLGDSNLFDLNIGQRITNNQLVENGKIPVYSANVTKPFGYINERLIDDFSEPSVIWGIDGDWQVGYLKENAEFYPTDHIGYLRVKSDEILPKYIVSLIEEQGHQLGYSRTNRASLQKMRKMQIVIPPMKEQERIVAEIVRIEGEQLKAQQEINKINSKITESLERVGGKTKQLNLVAKTIEYGYTTSALEKGDTRFIRITDINSDGKLSEHDVKYVNLDSKSEKCLLSKDDILVARTGATYGKTLIWKEDYPAVFASFLIKINFNDEIKPYFYYIFTKTANYWEQARNLRGGSGQPQFNGNALKKLQIPVPSIAEQDKIIEFVKPLEDAISILQNKIEEYEQERNTLYNKHN